MSRWWHLDPDVVKRWSMPEFTDRQEFMDIQMELASYDPNDPDAIEPGRDVWTGPKG